jgi:hypothetical protein
MTLRKLEPRLLRMSVLVILVFSISTSSLVLNGKASPASSYYYRFTVDREGFTNVEINFSSTDSSGSSWVFVPKFSSWNRTVTVGEIIGQPEVVATNQVASDDYYFYEAFKFNYHASGFFNMTVKFGFANGALIIEPDGIFYSPQIGFQSGSVAQAEVLFDENLVVTQDGTRALAIGATGDSVQATLLQTNRALFNLPVNIVRIQVELSLGSATPDYVNLMSGDNKTFAFRTPLRYLNYSRAVLNLYDQIYGNFTRLFNVTLENIVVQWFLPDFETLLTIGGFVPLTEDELGDVNINVFFIRAVNGTVEIIASHELVHRFLGKAGLSAGSFLWFHEGMAQYVSLSFVEKMGHDEAVHERSDLDQSAVQLVAARSGNIGFVQQWSPFSQPVDLTSYYVASYYVVSELGEMHGGLDFYQSFFQLIYGSNVNSNDLLAFYLSKAANASVALTLRRWGFSVTDLYISPDLVDEAARAVQAANPLFQPYRWLAEFLFDQALVSFEDGNVERGNSLLRLSMSIARAAPVLTILTIATVLALLSYFFFRRSRKPKPVVPMQPYEIFQPST